MILGLKSIEKSVTNKSIINRLMQYVEFSKSACYFFCMIMRIIKTFILILIVISVFTSCVSVSLKDISIVQKIDTKILEEFNADINEGDFYGASKSYIEYLECCNGEYKQVMVSRLENLFHDKLRKLEKEKKDLDIITLTFSYLNLMDESLSGDKKEDLKSIVHNSVVGFVERELSNKGELEKASWLIYLTNYAPGDSFLYRSIVELFLERENPFLARKYLEDYRSISKTEKENELKNNRSNFQDLEERLDELEKTRQEIQNMGQLSVERTIKSSVKIVVDRGITTQGGVGIPDQILGTGVTIDPRGYIITNYHLIESSIDPQYEGYSRIYVVSGKDETSRLVAKVVGYDSVFDLALLKVEKNMESHIILGDSDGLKQGERVMAIGNPVGLTNTVTSGVVSSLDRPFFQIGSIIQIDAALNPGNSGGALIDEKGALVGIAFAGLENFENLNFAIPSNLILSILFRLYEGGEVKRSWVGCTVEEKNGEILINYTAPESPGALSGLKPGDRIKEIGQFTINHTFDAQNIIANLTHPVIMNITLERDSKIVMEKVVLALRPVLPTVLIYRKDTQEKIITPLFGMIVTTVEPPRKKTYIVSRVISGSVASRVGITEGDEIRVRNLKYDEKEKIFYLSIDLRSKRFGYLNESMVLYSYEITNNFI